MAVFETADIPDKCIQIANLCSRLRSAGGSRIRPPAPAHERRRIVDFGIADVHPSASWTGQQVIKAFPDDTAPRWLVPTATPSTVMRSGAASLGCHGLHVQIHGLQWGASVRMRLPRVASASACTLVYR